MVDIETFSSFNGWSDGAADRLVSGAREVMDSALSADLRDDRFSSSWADQLLRSDYIGALASDNGSPVGYAGGFVDDGTIQLDALACPDGGSTTLSAMLEQLLPDIGKLARVELWAKPATDQHADLAQQHGFEVLRALHQMRCALPVDADIVETRSFVSGQDEEALLRVNNRAFASHPDQGNMTVEDLATAAKESWFDPQGIRLHEVDGVLAGFCWTKIHDEPRLGEIYAIGVDPNFHGQGLGVPMTNAGLHWMAQKGLSTGMLYVEADNEPALRTYDRLGFTVLRTDRAWVRSDPTAS